MIPFPYYFDMKLIYYFPFLFSFLVHRTKRLSFTAFQKVEHVLEMIVYTIRKCDITKMHGGASETENDVDHYVCRRESRPVC